MNDPSADLIEEIYATALEPARYDDLLKQWVALTESWCAKAPARFHVVATNSALERHVRRALKIFDRMGRDRRTRQSAETVLAGLPVAALIIDERLAVVASNQAVRLWLAPSPRPCLLDLCLDEAAESRIRAWIASRRCKSEPVLLVPCFLGSSASPSCITITRVDLSHPLALVGLELEVHQGDFFLVTTIDLQLDERVAQALSQAYQLSAAEAEVALALTRGHAPCAIASKRQVSLHTVRTQIKTVLRKMSAASIPDLVRMVGGLAASVTTSLAIKGADAAAAAGRHRRRKAVLRLNDGRLLAYEECGDPAGRPVLFVHNMLQGPALTEAAAEVAERKNWRFIGPSRPGFGLTDRATDRRSSLPGDVFARDVRQLLDHLDLDRALLLGHLSGGVHALRLAELMPERFAGLLLVNYVPAYRDDLLATLPARQKAFALTIRHAPHLLPFVARAGAAYIDAGCEDQLLQTLHGSVPADLLALRRPEVRHAAMEGLRHAVRQGIDGFCDDCGLILKDWTSCARSLRLPAQVILGAEDAFTRPSFARECMQNLPQFDLKIVERAGMYLLYTHWPVVFEALELLGCRGQEPRLYVA